MQSAMRSDRDRVSRSFSRSTIRESKNASPVSLWAPRDVPRSLNPGAWRRGWQALANLVESGEGTLDRSCHVYGLYRFHRATERANVVLRPEPTEISRDCLIDQPHRFERYLCCILHMTANSKPGTILQKPSLPRAGMVRDA